MRDNVEKTLIDVLKKAQESLSNHQKYLKVLQTLYNETDPEVFFKVFFKKIVKILKVDTIANHFASRALNFVAQFVALIESASTQGDEYNENVLISNVIREVLKFHNVDHVNLRYNSCQLVLLILQHLDQLEDEICDMIQDAMLERMHDPKYNIRIQAVRTLVRFQDPTNADCPVIAAYVNAVYDVNPGVRKEVLKAMSPNGITLSKIKERIRDPDISVRVEAFKKCAEVGPKMFRIVERQFILLGGFNETNKQARKMFEEYLLPKWITAYNGEFLDFFRALKLDADWKDIQRMDDTSRKLIRVLFKLHPIKDIISALHLNSDKLLPINKLSIENTYYWYLISNYLRQLDDGEDYLENVLPELTPFCNYIQSAVKEKLTKKMDDWAVFDYELILYNLFLIVDEYDLSDEVGRRTLKKLLIDLLQSQKFNYNLVKKLVFVLDKLFTNFDEYANEICQIVSEISEPMIDDGLSEAQIQEKEFRLASMRIKLNCLNEDKQTFIDNKEFLKVVEIEEKIAICKQEMEKINKEFEPVKVKCRKDSPETICHCLDVIRSFLLVPRFKKFPVSITTCKNEFIMPLLTYDNAEVNWRVLNCIAVFCIFSKTIAEENAKILAIPMISYRTIPDSYNKNALIISVQAVANLLRLYGTQIFGVDENNASSTKRRLYQDDDLSETAYRDSNVTIESMIETLLDMLDDEEEELKDVAVETLLKLICNEFPVNPLLLSRIILKWCNPISVKEDTTLQQKLGLLIELYVKKVKGSHEIIQKAIIPTLISIANAPRTSPLADIDVDEVIKFFVNITDISTTVVHLHRTLAQDLCRYLASKPHDPVVPYLAKLLAHLNIPASDATSTKELINSAELLEEDIVEKNCKKNVRKFIEKMNLVLEQENKDINENENIIESNSETEADSSTNNKANNGTKVPDSEDSTENEAEAKKSSNDKEKSNENVNENVEKSAEKRNSVRVNKKNNESAVTDNENNDKTPENQKKRNSTRLLNRKNSEIIVSVNENDKMTGNDLKTPEKRNSTRLNKKNSESVVKNNEKSTSNNKQSRESAGNASFNKTAREIKSTDNVEKTPNQKTNVNVNKNVNKSNVSNKKTRSDSNEEKSSPSSKKTDKSSSVSSKSDKSSSASNKTDKSSDDSPGQSDKENPTPKRRCLVNISKDLENGATLSLKTAKNINLTPVKAAKNKSINQDANQSLNETASSISENSSVQVKRKKRRGRPRKDSRSNTSSDTESKSTTITETSSSDKSGKKSSRVSSVSSTRSMQTRSRSQVVVSDTSSDSEHVKKARRKSLRKVKKRDMPDFVAR